MPGFMPAREDASRATLSELKLVNKLIKKVLKISKESLTKLAQIC